MSAELEKLVDRNKTWEKSHPKIYKKQKAKTKLTKADSGVTQSDLSISLSNSDCSLYEPVYRILRQGFTPPRIYKVTSSLSSCETNGSNFTLVFQINTTVIKNAIPSTSHAAIEALTKVRDMDQAKVLLSKIKLTQT